MVGFKMPVFPAPIDLIVNGEVLGVLPLPLGAFPVLGACWRVLKSSATGELRELRGFVPDGRFAVRARVHGFCSFPL